MSKKKNIDNNFNMKIFLKLIQESIKVFLFFLISYVWVSSYNTNKAFAIILSISIGIFLEIISLIISRKNTNKTQLKLSQQTNAEKMFLSLLLDDNPLEFFEKLFRTRLKNVIKKSAYLILTDHENINILFYPFLKISPLTEDKIIEISKLEKNIDKILIICNTKSDKCENYLSHIKNNVVLLDKYQTYSQIFEEYDYFPEIKLQEKAKQTLKARFGNVFSITKTKGYIFAGIFLLLSSFYSPFSIYYKITSSILFLFATICLCSNKTKKEPL